MLAKESLRGWRRKRIAKRMSVLCLLTLSLLFSELLASSTASVVQAEPFASPYFRRTWETADRPVLENAVKRSFIYGPEGFFTTYEPYAESPNGQRLVQYFDKARLELTQPGTNPDTLYYVTNGLLVKEMILGSLQLGNDLFVSRFPAYAITVAGDQSDVNPDAPTYASFYNVASTQVNRPAQPRTGEGVNEVISKNGSVTTSNTLGAFTTYGYYDPTLRHNVAKPFYDFFNRNGTIFTGNGYGNGRIFDWLYTVGYPLTEPYWIVTRVGGVQRDVLVQMFERRVLTWTPTNPIDFQVEMGNVGRHYYSWRYDARYDLNIPPAINGTINPQAGLPGAKFVLKSKFFQQDEGINVVLIAPNGVSTTLGFILPPQLDTNGIRIGDNYFGDVTLVLQSNGGAALGLYTVIFTGLATQNVAKFTFALIGIPGLVAPPNP